MSAAALPFEAPALDTDLLGPVRVRGGVRLSLESRLGRTVIGELSEYDGYKVRFPKERGTLQAVLINTGGGVASGDHIRHAIALGKDAVLNVTTPAAERIYRAADDRAAQIKVQAKLGKGARLHWLPQEMIIFNGAHLSRSISLEMDPSATALLAETVIFGRAAMGERVKTGFFRDVWRIRRGGRLVFAENVLLDGAIAETLAANAIAQGAHVIATVLFVAPNAGDRLDAVRRAIAGAGCLVAASSWNGLVVLRALGHSGEMVRAAMATLIPILSGETIPSLWET